LPAQNPLNGKNVDSVSSLASSGLITIGNITGNKKTKDYIILRELPFKTEEKYTITDLVKKFEDARRQLMNTALFQLAIVSLKDIDGDRIIISVDVKERWYLFPAPYFKPIDRNLNQWIVEQKASLDRVNYGAKLIYNNVTGQNDKLRVWLINGYTKQVSASYDRLYIDKKLRWGLKTSFAFGKNREVNYNTVSDKQVFLKDNDNYLHSFFNTFAELTYRKAINTRHHFGVGYSADKVKDTVVALNPAYYKYGKNNISFPTIYYTMDFSDFDFTPYPTKGYGARISVYKKGLNSTFNVWGLSAKGSGNWHFTPRIFLSAEIYGGIKLPFRQPWFNQRFLGYGDTFMQGYEYYVIDGAAGGYLKTTLTRELLNFNIRIPNKKTKIAEHIPVRIFGKMYGNAGYVYNPLPGDNFLSNKMLYSGGFGIDILTFYDVTIKLEYTFNQIGQNGLFLHRKNTF
jgi:outer membrane protein assembly factor BamA